MLIYVFYTFMSWEQKCKSDILGAWARLLAVLGSPGWPGSGEARRCSSMYRHVGFPQKRKRRSWKNLRRRPPCLAIIAVPLRQTASRGPWMLSTAAGAEHASLPWCWSIIINRPRPTIAQFGNKSPLYFCWNNCGQTIANNLRFSVVVYHRMLHC